MPEEHYKSFDVARAHIAQELKDLIDRSTKGSIDEPVLPFLRLFNSHPDWITTSTCSGRLVSYLPGSAISNGIDKPLAVNGKGGGDWLFVSHSTLSTSQLANPISTIFGGRSVNATRFLRSIKPDECRMVHLTYQPPVLHLMARSVEIAAVVLRAAIAAGFRNSGLTIGQRGKVILAIRSSTGGLDVPIACLSSQNNETERFELVVEEDYLSNLLKIGHELMSKNQSRLTRLFTALESSLKPSNQVIEWEPQDERRKRMKAEGLLAAQSKLKLDSFKDQTTKTQTENDSILVDIGLFED
ncbi:hypothetical protein CROQUDRAFT_653115 [Cronartium quercuum f. sp. fusiforme G11]|uniref:tRNA wybutosine-synthesizing protein 3 n=1 Tax=Cronartium quercuum f. sp. fusiforme G11 TaxID=708437 RepID=A0A9P6TER1_9BASI|nr:hypothetical protein CROQUDRAFT_653115 [Cronartium quercuum f. sp. fusiforme G11]